jgi:hypothetical protein
MNVASVFDRSGGRYLVGTLLFSPIPKIGPIPTPPPLALPGPSMLDARLVLAPRSLKQSDSRAILE